jgi:hypothetical protein
MYVVLCCQDESDHVLNLAIFIGPAKAEEINDAGSPRHDGVALLRRSEASPATPELRGPIVSPSANLIKEAARLGASGPNKRATLTTYLLKKGELRNSSLLDKKKAKSSPPERKHQVYKKTDRLL